MKEITAYQCDYCNKIYGNPKQAKAHERKCYYNPKTKSCATCDNLFLAYEKVMDGGIIVVPVQYCKKRIDISQRLLKTLCDFWTEKEETGDIIISANQSK